MPQGCGKEMHKVGTKDKAWEILWVCPKEKSVSVVLDPGAYHKSVVLPDMKALRKLEGLSQSTAERKGGQTMGVASRLA